MPSFGPISRRRLVTIPNPHTADIGVGLLAVILTQAGVARAERERV